MDPEIELLLMAILGGERGSLPLDLPQDVTRVLDPTQPVADQTKIENLLRNILEGADPTLGIATGASGLKPQDPSLPIQLAAGLLTGGSLIRGGKALGGAALRGGRSVIDMLRGGLKNTLTGTSTTKVLGRGEDDILKIFDDEIFARNEIRKGQGRPELNSEEITVLGNELRGHPINPRAPHHIDRAVTNQILSREIRELLKDLEP